jgi:hypothetical protein
MTAGSCNAWMLLLMLLRLAFDIHAANMTQSIQPGN